MDKHTLATVVTAFFPIPSKAPPSFYLATAKDFFKNCPAKIILFTTALYVPIFKEMLGPHNDVTIYEEEVDELGIPTESPVKNWIPLRMWEKIAEIFNKRAPRFNNNVSVSLMILYLSKAWYVNKAISTIKENIPIFWHDIGSARHIDQLCRLRQWPLISKLGDLSDNKIRFFKRKVLPTEYCYDCDNDSFIAGSHIFGNRTAWAPLIDDIKNAVLDNVAKYEDGLCDETIYLKLVMTLPERYTALGPNWEWYKTFEIHGDNRLVFDVSDNSTLIIYPQHGNDNQIFLLIYSECKQYFSIKSKSNDLVFSDNNGLCFEDYNGSDAQLFSSDKISGSYGYIKHKSSDKVLDVYDFGRTNTIIVLWEQNGGNNQLFCFNEITKGNYHIQVNYS